ncbi:MAG: amidohydrolase [Actinomycetota bacterium]
MSTDVLELLLAGIEPELPAACALRERLHARPELSWQEHETAAAVTRAIGGGTRGVAGTGLLASAGSGAVGVGVRAELDALPLREETTATFAATEEAMHACGHDVHAAALVALLRSARGIAEALPLPLTAIFQPSEESYPSGAEQLVRDGSLAGLGAIVAVHLHPDLPWGSATADGGPVNASADNFRIVVTGAAGHAAYPHRARDPLVALAHVVVALQTAVSRRLDPMHDAVVTIGWMRGGATENVIPADAEAGGTLRSLQPEDRDPLRQAVAEIAAHAAAACGCSAVLELTEGEPAIVNDIDVAAAVRPLLVRAGFGEVASLRSCGSDDFGFFGAASRLLLVFVGLAGAPGFAQAPLHHPGFLPPNEAVGAVARAQAAAYVGAATALASAPPPPA